MLTIAGVVILAVILFLIADYFDLGLKEINGKFIDLSFQSP